MPIGLCQHRHRKERDMAHVPEEQRNFQKELDRLLEVLIEEEGAEAI